MRNRILKSDSCNIFSKISKQEIEELVNITSFLPDDSSVNKRYYHVKNNINSIVKCICCGNEAKFVSNSKGYRRYCTPECKKKHTIIKNEQKKLEQFEKDKELVIKFPNDYISCEICGASVKSIASHLQKNFHDGINTDVYKSKFPNAPIIAKNLQIKLSEGVSGENNPNHTSNTTKEERQSRSPYSKKFLKYESEDDYNNFFENVMMPAFEDRLLPSNVGYWTNQGFSEEEARIKVSESQTTFSLELCIQRYGKEEGERVWKERQIKWSNSYKKMPYSLISQELFKDIFKSLSKEQQNKCKFAQWDSKNNKFVEEGKNFEQRLVINGKVLLPDFILDNKIIEFDGAYWHNVVRQQHGNSERDKIRDKYLIEAGYQVLHIKELDYYKDKNKELIKCLNFLNDM